MRAFKSRANLLKLLTRTRWSNALLRLRRWTVFLTGSPQTFQFQNRVLLRHEETAHSERETVFGGASLQKVLGEINSGASITSLARSHGISDQTIYKWRERYQGMSKSELTQLRALRGRIAVCGIW